MKHFHPLFLIFFLGISQTVNAQTWFAYDPAWTYHIAGGFAGINDYFNLEITADTIINGQACKKITTEGLTFKVLADRYAYADGDSFFAYQEHADTFVKLYDFSLLPGDTMVVPTQFGVFQYRVDSVDVVLAGLLYLRRQQVSYVNPNGSPSSWKFDILENVGMVGKPFEDTIPSCSYLFIDEAPFCNSVVDGYDIKFVCFRSSIGDYSPYNFDCQVVNTDQPEAMPEFSLSPNPASEWLFIKTTLSPEDVLQTSVFSAQGTMLQTLKGLPAQMPVSDLPLGLYFLKIELENGQGITRRFIKI